mmetsp:Transcript_115917/g.368597  ORF Transcript_115917/g.368597 Transcript_115917/m.368597 type:complete len:92 (+) Transcript_115917:1113-1388(+)
MPKEPLPSTRSALYVKDAFLEPSAEPERPPWLSAESFMLFSEDWTARMSVEAASGLPDIVAEQRRVWPACRNLSQDLGTYTSLSDAMMLRV